MRFERWPFSRSLSAAPASPPQSNDAIAAIAASAPSTCDHHRREAAPGSTQRPMGFLRGPTARRAQAPELGAGVRRVGGGRSPAGRRGRRKEGEGCRSELASWFLFGHAPTRARREKPGLSAIVVNIRPQLTLLSQQEHGTLSGSNLPIDTRVQPLFPHHPLPRLFCW